MNLKHSRLDYVKKQIQKYSKQRDSENFKDYNKERNVVESRSKIKKEE